MSKSANWLCTLNNPDIVFDSLWDPSSMAYLVGQLEQGSNGTRHYQFYIEFKTRKMLSALKKVHNSIHAEVRRGTQEQAITYVTKEETRVEGPWTFGEKNSCPQGGGDRKSQKYVTQAALTKEERKEQLSPYQIVQLQKAELIVRQWDCLPNYGPRECFWIWGEPGTGKSRYVKSFKPYLKAQNKWWDGYLGHHTVLIDDFDKQGTCLSHYLKIWADPYGEVTGEVKGSHLTLGYMRLYITSNYTIEELFEEDPQLVAALSRRFKQIRMQSTGEWISSDGLYENYW